MAEKKIFLLDAFALIYRAHFAFMKNPRITSSGINTSAVFGFTNTLLEILTKEKPTHIAVAFDTKEPTFRHIEFPAYKAQRDEVPEDIIVAVPLIKRLLTTLNIPIIEKPGFEADDLIGAIAKKAEGHGYQVYMVTPDKDYAQLVTNNVFLYKPARSGNEIEILDPDGVEKSMGVRPEFVVDFLGLKGDAVDNIPGIPKVGDKTALELIAQFGSVENIIKNADQIKKNAVRESVILHAEQGLLSKKLATILTDIDLPWNEEDLLVGNPERKDFLELMEELEFKATAQRILQSAIFGDAESDAIQKDLFGNVVSSKAGKAEKISSGSQEDEAGIKYQTIENRKHEYHILETLDEINTFAKKVIQNGEVCFDSETTGLDPMLDELVALTFSLAAETGVMIYFPEKDNAQKEKLEIVRTFLEHPKVLKVGQNLKFDMLLLKNYGIDVCEPLFDTMLASYVINPDRSHSMDSLSKEYLNYEPVSITELIGKKGKQQLTMRHVKLSELKDYACEDADITLALKEKMAPIIISEELTRVFDQVETPLVPVLTDMEFQGIKIDKEALAEISIHLEKEMLIAEKEIYRLAGRKFNINSPKQLGGILFDVLKLATGKKTAKGQYSTKEEVLVELASEHEMPANVLRFRQLGKLKSTYVDALPLLINPKTGRVHTTYGQAIASTGRLSSNNPNLQNIPIRTDEGKEIRKAFIPEDGFYILSADYSQIELRLMAEFSKDPGMQEAFIQGEDIHRATAAKVFGVELGEVTSEMRSRAKMVNFGIIYGISAFGLAQRLAISRTEAAEIIRSYFEKYAGVKSYMDESIEFARQNGFVTTIMGRRRYLPDINSQNQTQRGFAERNAINTPIQGSAAELIKVAMISIWREMNTRKMKSKMLLQVHDELVFECWKSELEELKALVKDKMENAIKFVVPMSVEMGYGANWLEAH